MGSRIWQGITLLVVGVLLAGLGAGIARRTTPTTLTARPTQPVTDDPQLAINTNTSPVVVADPRRPDVLVAAGRVDAPRLNCTVSVSSSGGEAWRRLDLPLPAGAANCFWPDVAFDDDGGVLVLYTPTSGPFELPDSLWLQHFSAEFAPTGPATRVAGALTFQPRLAIGGGRVLVAWIQAARERAEKSLGFPSPPNPVVLAASDDGGHTFSAPVTVGEAARLTVQPSVLALSGDRVLVGALDLGDDRETYETTHQGVPGPAPTVRWRIVAWTSGDGGRTFGAAVVVSDAVVPTQRVLIDVGPAPAFAVDPGSERIYAAWESGHDVLLSRSVDGATSWSPPRPVGPTKGSQFLPGIGVGPDGRVDVAYYDRSRDPTDVLADVVMASSSDGGRSFTTAVVSGQPFDATVGSFNGDTIMLGSHLAVLAGDHRSTIVWPDTVRGNRVNNIVDLVSATVNVGHGPRVAARAILVVGVLLALLGGALTARSWPGRGAARGRSS